MNNKLCKELGIVRLVVFGQRVGEKLRAITSTVLNQKDIQSKVKMPKVVVDEEDICTTASARTVMQVKETTRTVASDPNKS